LPGQPTIILDVAHNPHAAATLSQNLGNMGFHPYTYAVFGSMQDKDIAGVIEHLKGQVDHWCVTDLPLPRAATAEEIREKLIAAYGESPAAGDTERSIQTFATPAEAFANAMSRAGENDRITVFGSFLTVAGVMEFRQSEHH
jgi:dihydrofolate synthase/folylpolyglutamate synthase